jgi:hypothetical protein
VEIKTTVDFDFTKVKSSVSKMFKEFSTENLDDVVSQLKGNIEKFKGEPISPMTRSVRLVRGITGAKPLISTGNLLNSIKKTKKGVSFNAYGAKQHEGFTFRQGWNNGKEGFYADRLKKALYQVKGGTKVEARPWIKYIPRARALDTFFSKFMSKLRIPNKTIFTKRF